MTTYGHNHMWSITSASISGQVVDIQQAVRKLSFLVGVRWERIIVLLVIGVSVIVIDANLISVEDVIDFTRDQCFYLPPFINRTFSWCLCVYLLFTFLWKERTLYPLLIHIGEADIWGLRFQYVPPTPTSNRLAIWTWSPYPHQHGHKVSCKVAYLWQGTPDDGGLVYVRRGTACSLSSSFLCQPDSMFWIRVW